MGRAILSALFLVVVACSHKPFEVSTAEQQRFKAGLIQVPMAGGDRLIEGLDNCVVYKAVTSHQDIVGWTAVLGADWGGSYPKFLTSCTSQSIAFERSRVIVRLCAQAIGAGGGCANGGLYESPTGQRPWRYSRDGGATWKPLPT